MTSSAFATRQVAGWTLGTSDVIVSWIGPGPNQRELREFCSRVGRVRFVILDSPGLSYGRRDAAVRFATMLEAKRATKELDGEHCRGVTLSVRWSKAEEAWGGRPAWDSVKADVSWKYAEFEPTPPEVSRRIMEAWATKKPSDEPLRRHGVPALDWHHDAVAKVNVNVNSDYAQWCRLHGQRPPVAIAPEGHPRLRTTDRGPMRHLPYDSQEDELQLYWDLEIT